MNPRGVASAVAALALGLLGATLGTPGSTPAASAAGTGVIGPGVQMGTQGSHCTANFVFHDQAGRIFVGYAARCAARGSDAQQSDGCAAASLPYGTRVRFARGMSASSKGSTVGFGRLYWSSWSAMRRSGVTDTTLCHHNDFALVRVEAASLRRVNPTVPFWGGPTGLAGPPGDGGRVYTYGSSDVPGGEPTLTPKSGKVTQRYYRGATIFTPSPGVSGDTGSGFLDNSGRAAGTLSTLTTAPEPGTNGVGSLRSEVRFANSHGLAGLRVVKGREPFTRSAVG